MTKEQTIQIKGIAILMMVFYHLFNRIEFVSLYEDFILPSGNTLSFVLTNCLNPVNYYLILSGYGMYCVWSHTDKRKWKRILSLIFHFWLIAALFICIGAFLYPSKKDEKEVRPMCQDITIPCQEKLMLDNSHSF